MFDMLLAAVGILVGMPVGENDGLLRFEKLQFAKSPGSDNDGT